MLYLHLHLEENKNNRVFTYVSFHDIEKFYSLFGQRQAEE